MAIEGQEKRKMIISILIEYLKKEKKINLEKIKGYMSINHGVRDMKVMEYLRNLNSMDMIIQTGQDIEWIGGKL